MQILLKANHVVSFFLKNSCLFFFYFGSGNIVGCGRRRAGAGAGADRRQPALLSEAPRRFSGARPARLRARPGQPVGAAPRSAR